MKNLLWHAAIKPSRYFTGVLLALHLGGATVVYLTSIWWVAKFIMWLLIVVSLIYYVMRDVALRFPSSWREISLNQNDVTIITQNDSKLTGLLSDKSMVSGKFVILRMRLEGRYFTVARVIFRDALNPGMFRQLCVCLRFNR